MEISIIINLIIIILLAILTGTITGLIPGLHINFISILILINHQTLINYISIESLAIFIIIMSLTHSFLDFIPSIIFGIPNEQTALSILPGQKLLLKGEGYKAIYLSSLGSLFGVITSLFIGIIFYFILETLQNQIRTLIPLILSLIIVLGIMIEPSKHTKYWSIILILFTGGYGILILNSTQISQPLLILFSGIFATASIIHSTTTNSPEIPKQNYKINHKINKKFLTSLINGSISSSLCSITPGIGNIQAATLSELANKKLKKLNKSKKETKNNNKEENAENFISMISLINTNNFILSLITFLTISKARNGSIFVISQILTQITLNQIIFYYILILLTTPIIFYLTLKIGKLSIKKFTKLNIKKINITLLLLITLSIVILEGIFGFLALLGATFLGYLCLILKVKRIHMMTVLIIPIIINLI